MRLALIKNMLIFNKKCTKKKVKNSWTSTLEDNNNKNQKFILSKGILHIVTKKKGELWTGIKNSRRTSEDFFFFQQ